MKTFILLLSLLSAHATFADPKLIQEFKKTFESHYEAGKCGPNIVSLLQRASSQGINISKARILEIENKGFSVFGMLNAEYARESGPHGSAGETNWFHHVILEKDGLIYDYDFGNSPQIVSTKEYFEKMFLVEKKKAEGGDFYVGREEKLKTYEITIKSATETLKAINSRVASPEGVSMKLFQFLN